MNIITITGNVGADAQLVALNYGDVASFSVGVTEGVKNADGTWGNHTIWYSCKSNKTNLIPFLTRGVPVLVQGKPYAVIGKDRNAYINVNVTSIEIMGKSAPKVSNGQVS